MGPKKISQIFQRRLLICVSLAFFATTLFLWILQTELSERNAIDLLRLNISDVRHDVDDASDENLLELTRVIAKIINSEGDVDSDRLDELAEQYDLAEINRVAPTGHIAASTNGDFLGYNMAWGKQSAEFLPLLNGYSEYAQKYQPISYDAAISRKYAGVSLEDGGFVQVGYDARRFQRDIDSRVIGATRNRHVGENGCIIICSENGRIVSDRYNNEGKALEVTGLSVDKLTMPEEEYFTALVYEEPCYCLYVIAEGYYIIAVIPQSEAVLSRNVSVGVTTAMEIAVFVVLFVLIYMLISRLIVENIHRINHSLSQITDGNLDVTVDVRSNEEFSALSDGINSTVDTLKKYIDEAAARIDKELAFAKAIQHAALPSVFPPYPNRTDFDIYARMDTAKEVGGDFYDFYFVDEDRFAVLIADVSGKGIPAAMFMMRAKTLLKSYAESGMKVNEVFTRVNKTLCAGNDTDMFVTAWMGFIDLKTGLMRYANAGHNRPLVYRRDGGWTYLTGRSGFVLAGMDDVVYREQELRLEPGDALYLYTDGVTEATDAGERLYGDERLIQTVNGMPTRDMKALCDGVKADVDAFVGSEPQFDDITMLAFHYMNGL